MERELTIIAALMLLLAFALPATADQSPKKTATVDVPEIAPRVQLLRKEVAQLQEKLSERRMDPAERAWQRTYEEKLKKIRARQQFEGRYLGNGE